TMEVSEVDGTSNIGGITQPIIGQRKIEHEVRLKEGEVNLLGGMMEDQQTRALSGFPGLAQIPILRYLFSQTDTEHRETETVFVLIPHIVRSRDYTELNQQALDVATANAIELRRVSHPVTPPPGSPAGAAPAIPPQTPGPVPVPPGQAAVPPGNATFSFDSANVTQSKGSTFTVSVLLAGAQNAHSVPLQISYDPKLLQVVNVSNGSFLS